MPEAEHLAGIQRFLSRDSRARFEEFPVGSRLRSRLLNRLCHGYESILDWRIAQPIASAEQSPEAVWELLRARGAGRTCYALCTKSEWDGREVPLDEALRALMGNGLPVLLSCVPGMLGYFEPEYEAGAGRRFVLQATS
jgi:hypothetical protein